MASYESLCVITNEGKARLAQMTVTGKSFKVDKFVIGDQGHDPIDPTFALTPDPARTGCYCTTEGLHTTDGCTFEGLIDSIAFTSATCPVFTIVLAAGEATGVISSVCLVGTIVYSPIPADPEIGTEFLFGIANFPYRIKLPEEQLTYDLNIAF